MPKTNPEASLDETTAPTPTSFDDTPTDIEAPAFDLDSWLSGASVMAASVDIVQQASLLGEYAAWERKYEAAKENGAAAGGEATLGDESPLAALEREGAALRQRIAASTSTWFVRALSLDEQRGIIDAIPAPEEPATFSEPTPRLVPQPTEAQSNAYLKATEAWELRRNRFNKEHKAEHEKYEEESYEAAKARRAETISLAVTRIEVSGRVIAEAGAHRAITAEQAAALTAQIGETQVGRIQDAINLANSTEPEVPAAFLPTSSSNDRS
ncbi:hypothetical protein ACFT5B_06970 [Luteimicrobium sp. NPDC057192]|uniref:hypothetical protein n=1 Tax=Luteimicrobium sp. NPDC057192 TaxID=3346042 RepID=UPI003630880C